MAISSAQDEDIIAEINVTPLVDVCLVLVIIFMVIAPFVTQILKPLSLPTAQRTGMTEQNTIKVSLFPDGTLAVGATLISIGELSAKLKEEQNSGKPPWVIIRAGAEIAHRDVMNVMKIVKEFGAERVAFAANPGAPAAPVQATAPDAIARQAEKHGK